MTLQYLKTHSNTNGEVDISCDGNRLVWQIHWPAAGEGADVLRAIEAAAKPRADHGSNCSGGRSSVRCCAALASGMEGAGRGKVWPHHAGKGCAHLSGQLAAAPIGHVVAAPLCKPSFAVAACEYGFCRERSCAGCVVWAAMAFQLGLAAGSIGSVLLLSSGQLQTTCAPPHSAHEGSRPLQQLACQDWGRSGALDDCPGAC